jgi:hypothetical protein
MSNETTRVSNSVETRHETELRNRNKRKVSLSVLLDQIIFLLSAHPFLLTILAVLASVVTHCVTPCSIGNRKRELSVTVSCSFLAWRGSWTVAVRHMIGGGDGDE